MDVYLKALTSLLDRKNISWALKQISEKGLFYFLLDYLAYFTVATGFVVLYLRYYESSRIPSILIDRVDQLESTHVRLREDLSRERVYRVESEARIAALENQVQRIKERNKR